MLPKDIKYCGEELIEEVLTAATNFYRVLLKDYLQSTSEIEILFATERTEKEELKL